MPGSICVLKRFWQVITYTTELSEFIFSVFVYEYSKIQNNTSERKDRQKDIFCTHCWTPFYCMTWQNKPMHVQKYPVNLCFWIFKNTQQHLNQGRKALYYILFYRILIFRISSKKKFLNDGKIKLKSLTLNCERKKYFWPEIQIRDISKLRIRICRKRSSQYCKKSAQIFLIRFEDAQICGSLQIWLRKVQICKDGNLKTLYEGNECFNI